MSERVVGNADIQRTVAELSEALGDEAVGRVLRSIAEALVVETQPRPHDLQIERTQGLLQVQARQSCHLLDGGPPDQLVPGRVDVVQSAWEEPALSTDYVSDSWNGCTLTVWRDGLAY